MSNHNKLELGCTVIYIDFGGVTRTVKVDEIEDDMRNGRPGFAGICIGSEKVQDIGSLVWGYSDQIRSVQKEG